LKSLQIKSKNLAVLNGVEETLLIPLFARALETRQKNGLIRDYKSVEILDGLFYDVQKVNMIKVLQIAFAVRTRLVDDIVAGFLAKNPTGSIVNLGAGLDSRYYRLNNQLVHFVGNLTMVR